MIGENLLFKITVNFISDQNVTIRYVAWRIFQEKQVILYRITVFELNDCSTSVTGGFAP